MKLTAIQVLLDINERSTLVLGNHGVPVNHAVTADYADGYIELHGRFSFDEDPSEEIDHVLDTSKSTDQIGDT